MKVTLSVNGPWLNKNFVLFVRAFGGSFALECSFRVYFHGFFLQFSWISDYKFHFQHPKFIMGISGLLPLMKNATTKAKLSSLKGEFEFSSRFLRGWFENSKILKFVVFELFWNRYCRSCGHQWLDSSSLL